MEKIILITETSSGQYQARVFGKNPPVHAFAESEVKALKKLVEKIESIDAEFIQGL